MTKTKSDKGLHRLFELSIFIKGVDGVLETVGGLLILFVPLHSLDGSAPRRVVTQLVGGGARPCTPSSYARSRKSKRSMAFGRVSCGGTLAKQSVCRGSLATTCSACWSVG